MGRLYGIVRSNRRATDLWGKNQFNSAFPAAMLCYMRDRGVSPVYVRVEGRQVVNDEISIDEVFNTSHPNEDIYFDFESTYPPYQHLCYDDIGKIDLVICEADSDGFPVKHVRPLEVKLTVLPDNTTYRRGEGDWSSEMVIRPASTSWATLGILHSCEGSFTEIRRIFEPVGSQIQSWDNKAEILAKRKQILSALSRFYDEYHHLQKPFLVQPIWKTLGKSPELAAQCFDAFIWSDFALCKTFLDKAHEGGDTKVSRYMRSAARMFRVLFEVSRVGKVNIRSVYGQMTFNLQTDKEFALSGLNTLPYLPTPRRARPVFPESILREVILDRGYEQLSPERRFDQTIYFRSDKLFEE